MGVGHSVFAAMGAVVPEIARTSARSPHFRLHFPRRDTAPVFWHLSCVAAAPPMLMLSGLRTSAVHARSRGLVMRRAPRSAWTEHEGSLDWQMSGMRRQALLGRSREISITEKVRELNEWCGLRDEMASSLGRQPTQVRCATFPASTEPRPAPSPRAAHHNSCPICCLRLTHPDLICP